MAGAIPRGRGSRETNALRRRNTPTSPHTCHMADSRRPLNDIQQAPQFIRLTNQPAPNKTMARYSVLTASASAAHTSSPRPPRGFCFTQQVLRTVNYVDFFPFLLADLGCHECDMGHPAENAHAACRMPHAACRMPHAACRMPHETPEQLLTTNIVLIPLPRNTPLHERASASGC